MNLNRTAAESLAAGLAAQFSVPSAGVQVAVCPPFPYLIPVGQAVAGSGVELGAQNAAFEKPGAFTGEVSIDMLTDLGCRWVILGHSERRALFSETDAIVNRKVHAALGGGLPVILCVGETLAERQGGATDQILDRQMADSLAGVDAASIAQIVIAYEPVWAIGTGVTATTEQAESAHLHLRNWLSGRYNRELAEATRILYGGSVKPQNAKSLMEQPNVDGALVGGASLKLDDFLPIIRAAQSLRSA
ncbi:MAG: triose-phosphate isomerase [Planctomycetaceae bacterium]|nr:MAG: triose-phosphate isomerase [Planctomycetaceae bacterium]